jgi:hypothetical protein
MQSGIGFRAAAVAVMLALAANTWATIVIGSVGGPLETSFDKQSNSTSMRLPVGFIATAGGGGSTAEVQSRLFKGTLTTLFAGEKPATTVESFILVLTHSAKGQPSQVITFTIDGKQTVVATTLRDEVGGSQLIIAALPRTLVMDMAKGASKGSDMRLTANGFECQISNTTVFEALLNGTASR